MVADHQAVAPVVAAEMGQIAYIGYAGQRLFRSLDTAGINIAGFVYPVHLAVHGRRKLTGSIDPYRSVGLDIGGI